MIIIAIGVFVVCICVGVGIYFATKGGDSPAPAPDSGSPAPAPAPAPAPVPLTSLKYDYVGDGTCTNDQAAVRTACRTKPGCDTIGQQSNGCWHCLKTVSTGGGEPIAYTKGLFTL